MAAVVPGRALMSSGPVVVPVPFGGTFPIMVARQRGDSTLLRDRGSGPSAQQACRERPEWANAWGPSLPNCLQTLDSRQALLQGPMTCTSSHVFGFALARPTTRSLSFRPPGSDAEVVRVGSCTIGCPAGRGNVVGREVGLGIGKDGIGVADIVLLTACGPLPAP